MSRTTRLWGCVQVLLLHGFTSASARGLRRHGDTTTSSPLCIKGRAVPQLYLLGAMKSGTTTLALDLMRAGVRSAIGKEKELHAFDEMCGFGTNQTPYVCDNVAEKDISRWLQKFGRCQKPEELPATNALPVLTDMTPINLRFKGLPHLLRRIYGKNTAKELKFVIELRDPMTRMVSQYYHLQNKGKITEYANASQWAESLMTREAQLREKTKDHRVHASDILSLNTFDKYYRSLYGMNLKPWLAYFEPRQFVIVPMRTYVESLDSRHAIIDSLRDKFGLSLNSSALQSANRYNAISHPESSDIFTEKQRIWFNDRFERDARRLSGELVKAMKGGLVIAGYTGPAEEAAVVQYLSQNW